MSRPRRDLDDVAAAVLHRISQWTPASWAVAHRAGSTYEVISQLADLAAAAEGRPRHAVPRLTDTVLPDQLAVMVADLSGAEPRIRAHAAELVASLV